MPNKDTIAAMEKSELAGLKDEKLLDWLYKSYYEKALRNALFYCGTKQLAEDVMQDVFLKIWKNIDELQLKIKDWRAWHLFLFVLVRNRASNIMRKEKNKVAFLSCYEWLIDMVINDDWVLEKEYERLFKDAVEILTYQQKEVFVLRYYGFKPKIIAKELNVTAQTISNTLVSARKVLQDHVNKQFEINEALLKWGNERGYSHKKRSPISHVFN